MTNCTGKDILQALARPFHPDEIEWRVQSAAKAGKGFKLLVLPYIEARAVMNRLDEVMGTDWQTTYEKLELDEVKAFQCKLSLKINGEWITRSDGAEMSEIETVKGGHSNALKRAAVQWGIGRYLYNLPKFWVDLKETGEHRVYSYFKINGQKVKLDGYFDTPHLPKEALPTGYVSKPLAKPNVGNQDSPQPSQSSENGKKAVLECVMKYLTDLKIPGNYVVPLFQKASGSTATKINLGTKQDLIKMMNILRPVWELKNHAEKLGFKDVNDLLYYSQIVLKEEIRTIHSLYFKLTMEKVKEIIKLMREDLKQQAV